MRKRPLAEKQLIWVIRHVSKSVQSPSRPIRTFYKHMTSPTVTVGNGETQPLSAKIDRKHSKLRLCSDTYTSGRQQL